MNEPRRKEGVRNTLVDASLVETLREGVRDQHRDKRIHDLFWVGSLVPVEDIDQRIAERVVHG